MVQSTFSIIRFEQELSRWTGNWVDLWDEEADAADAVPPAPAAGAQEEAMVWEYSHDQHWYAYDRASTAALNAARRAGERRTGHERRSGALR